MKKHSFTVGDANVNGTYLQGEILCTYDRLCEIFGMPEEGDGYKTQAEWRVQTSDGVVFTIYDWKEYQEPMYVEEWHIGGYSREALDIANEIISNHVSN